MVWFLLSIWHLQRACRLISSFYNTEGRLAPWCLRCLLWMHWSRLIFQCHINVFSLCSHGKKTFSCKTAFLTSWYVRFVVPLFPINTWNSDFFVFEVYLVVIFYHKKLKIIEQREKIFGIYFFNVPHSEHSIKTKVA